MRPDLGTGRAIRSLWLGMAFGRCPSCLRTSMFRGFIELHDRCPVCGIQYQVESGAWLGAVVLGYAVGALVVVALGIIEALWHPIQQQLRLDPLWTITIIGLAVAAPAYRPAKGFWFALLWVYGFTGEPETPSPWPDRTPRT